MTFEQLELDLGLDTRDEVKVYMAGPMFTEAEVNERLSEAKKLRTKLLTKGLNHVKLYVPLEADINDKASLPTALDIFQKDRDELLSSDYVLACLDGEDAGVMAELGMVHKDIPVFAYMTDIRTSTAGNYEGKYVPWGYNQFVIGMLEEQGTNIHYKKDDVIDELIKTIQEN